MKLKMGLVNTDPVFSTLKNKVTMKKQTKKNSFTSIVTLEKSNKGVELIIPETDGETITILGIDSDACRIENDAILSELSDFGKGDKEPSKKEIAKRQDENQLRLLAKIVVGWSFDEECNDKNIKTLLVNAPHVRKFIDREAGNLTRFMGKS